MNFNAKVGEYFEKIRLELKKVHAGNVAYRWHQPYEDAEQLIVLGCVMFQLNQMAEDIQRAYNDPHATNLEFEILTDLEFVGVKTRSLTIAVWLDKAVKPKLRLVRNNDV